MKKDRMRDKMKKKEAVREHLGMGGWWWWGVGGIELIFHLGTCHNASVERQHQMSSFGGEWRAICQRSHREPLWLSALIPAHIYQRIPQGAFHLGQTDVEGSILHPHALAYIRSSGDIQLEDRAAVLVCIIASSVVSSSKLNVQSSSPLPFSNFCRLTTRQGCHSYEVSFLAIAIGYINCF